jgi:hypothetical protein
MATVIAHFYNEEYLLPWWLKHHLKLFDHGILINYGSTDNSVSICRDLAPNWEIINSRNHFFGAKECDEEVMDIESRVKGWKITLNITEFFCTQDIGIFVSSLEDRDCSMAALRGVVLCDRPDEDRLEPSHEIPLIEQVVYGFFEDYQSVPGIDFVTRSRIFHNKIHGQYTLGRHRTSDSYICHPKGALILWLGYSPWTERFIKRKLQIQSKIPDTDKVGQLGTHHLMTRLELEKIRSLAANHVIDLRRTGDFKSIIYGASPDKVLNNYPSIMQDYQIPSLTHFQFFQSLQRYFASILLHTNPAEAISWQNLINSYDNLDSDVSLSLQYINLAKAYYRNSNNEMLQYCSMLAIQFHHYITDGHFLLGISLFNQRHFDLARKYFEIAASQRPFDARVLFMLGLSLHQSGKNKLSAKFFQEAHRIRPDWSEAGRNAELVSKIMDI